MTSVFIVRPFGVKPVTVKDKDGKDISVKVDFNLIDKALIQPALQANRLAGVTTEVIAEAGNIRLDMFQMLISHDLVIADISIDNANVFYELGIRHGLRPKGTILLRFPSSGADVPFDLKTDRYIAYDRDNPASAVDLLTRSIKDTLGSMHSSDQRPDSPVFLLLPELRAPDPARLLVVPREFQEAVERAENDTSIGGPMLALLGDEAKRRDWGREGVRLVGRAQRHMQSFQAARRSWEFIRRDLPGDIEANLQLATIFQRLGDLVAASQACQRVLDNASAERQDRADAESQLARNQKKLWISGFKQIQLEQARRQQAIADGRLISAFEGYLSGFAEDMNDFYSGINALGLLTAIVELAVREPEAWAGTFATEDETIAALKHYRGQLADLRGAVRLSLESVRRRSERTGRPNEWLPASEAQYALLTSDKPAFVKSAYSKARNASNKFSVASEAEQAAMFGALGIFPEKCQAALEALGVPLPASGTAPGAVAAVSTAAINHVAAAPAPRDRVIVATGHRADAPGRASPRFPNTPACIDKARTWLRDTVKAEQAETKGELSAMAGAASGTDLLFHEVCAELGIKTTVVLPIPADVYRRDSVADGGADWVERFTRLINANPPVVLSDDAELPVWAADIPDYGVYQRGNIFMMENALFGSNADVTLLALWNGKAGDGPGGTADMVALAKAQGAKVRVADTDALFGLAK